MIIITIIIVTIIVININNNNMNLSIAHMLYIIQRNEQVCCVMSQLDPQTCWHDVSSY